MEKSEFQKPLLQSAAIVAVVFILFALIASSSTGGGNGGILALFSGIGNMILFLIGLSIAVPFSIAVVIAIFLGAVALYSRETSAQMYLDLKKNFSENIVVLKSKWTCCDSSSNSAESDGETNRMKEGLAQLKENNGVLHAEIQKLRRENNNLEANLVKLQNADAALNQQLDELDLMVKNLANSHQEMGNLTSNLDAKFETGLNTDLKDKISRLEQEQKQSNDLFASISTRLDSLETPARQSPVAGIFSYINSAEDQELFANTAEEAVSEEMTYSQIDEYFSEHLSPELNKIIKDHPSLSKTYIRNLRRD